MELQTRVEIPDSKVRIDYTRKLAFIGSCFAQNISERFVHLKFNALVNPFGIIYNPLSINHMIDRIVYQDLYAEKDVQNGTVFLDGENWNCWDFHGAFSCRDKHLFLDGLNRAIQDANAFLKMTDVVFITLGTAFVYFLQKSGQVVSNCHRANPELFQRRLVSVTNVVETLKNVVSNLKTLNPDVKVVFTVSPLRHMKDGTHGNNLSKSTLLLAVNQVVESCPENVEYFPSYEIVMDELRDYRFYASDMIHLSDVAEEYIFERLQETYMDASARGNLSRVARFMKSVDHKVVDKASLLHSDFVQKHIALAEGLETQIAGLDLQSEKQYFLSLQ